MNKVAIHNKYLIPQVVIQLAQVVVFTDLDLRSGYIRANPNCRGR